MADGRFSQCGATVTQPITWLDRGWKRLSPDWPSVWSRLLRQLVVSHAHRRTPACRPFSLVRLFFCSRFFVSPQKLSFNFLRHTFVGLVGVRNWLGSVVTISQSFSLSYWLGNNFDPIPMVPDWDILYVPGGLSSENRVPPAVAYEKAFGSR